MTKKKCKEGYKRSDGKCVRKGGIINKTFASREINCYNGGGVGFTSLLTLLFIGLKLGGVINWSWWWVLSPLWIPTALVLIFILIFVVILGRAFK